MNGRKIFVIGMCIGLLVTGFQLEAQPATVSFDKSTQDYLIAQMKAGRSEVIAEWAAKNPTLLNGRGPAGFTPLEMAIKLAAIYSFSALLDSGADPNPMTSIDGELADLLILTHMIQSDSTSLMRKFSESLLAHGYRWDNKIPFNGIEVSVAAFYIFGLPENSGTIDQLSWLATQGMNLLEGVIIPEAGLVSLEQIARQMEKHKFAAVLAQAAKSAAEAEAQQEKILEDVFFQKGSALGKFYGKDEDDNNQ